MNVLVTFMTILFVTYMHQIPMIHAKVSNEIAKQLGLVNTPLTPIGSERSGNKEGTIPDWKGGVIDSSDKKMMQLFPNAYQIPLSYKKGDFHACPFNDTKKRFTITASNYSAYKPYLTEGMIALFQTYPKTFFMHVYNTHRTASFPEWIYQASMENAVNAELAQEGNALLNARGSSPFPIPQNGLEVIWNHITHYRGHTIMKYGAQVTPTQDGNYIIMKMIESILIPYADPNATKEDIQKNNMLSYFLQIVTTPTKLAGTGLLIHDYIDQIKKPRNAWTYNTGDRRVRRSPNVAYDFPGTVSDGLRTTDDWDFFNGAPDRYHWTLKGKAEKFVAYNCYDLHSNNLKYKDILLPGHINQAHVRYELHRVWIVEADLKENKNHIYKKRRFYIDEDSWSALAAEMYDHEDQLWRVLLAHAINYYDLPTIWSTLDIYHDLNAQRYIATNLDNEGEMFDFTKPLTPRHFTSGALKRTSLR